MNTKHVRARLNQDKGVGVSPVLWHKWMAKTTNIHNSGD